MCPGPPSERVTLRLEPTQAHQGTELTPGPGMRVAWQAPLPGIRRHRATGGAAWCLLGMSLHIPVSTRLAAPEAI